MTNFTVGGFAPMSPRISSPMHHGGGGECQTERASTRGARRGAFVAEGSGSDLTGEENDDGGGRLCWTRGPADFKQLSCAKCSKTVSSKLLRHHGGFHHFMTKIQLIVTECDWLISAAVSYQYKHTLIDCKTLINPITNCCQ